MPDKIKVIKGLEACHYGNCPKCPYWGGRSNCSKRELLNDALQLLKDDEEE